MKISGKTSTNYIILFILSLITGGIVGIGLMIWQILYGRRWAWEYREWSDFEDYKKTQIVWDIWGKIILTIYVVYFIIFLIVELSKS